jgi:putative ABC transport system permease protein
MINVSGLAIGLAGSLLMFLWIAEELSYDRFHVNSRRIFRINTVFEENPEVIWTNVPFPVAPGLAERYPFIEEYSRKWSYPAMLKYGDQQYFEYDGILVDPGFFKMFSYPILKGEGSDLLTERHQIVLTESLANRLFGDDEPVGEVISMNDDMDLTVTGIISDPPGRSQYQFSFLASIQMLPQERLTSPSFDALSFIMIAESKDLTEARHQVGNFYNEIDSTLGASILLQPYANIHLKEAGDRGLSRYLRLFGIVALLILLVASINYMNLSIVRSLERSREISIRKVLGANPGAIRNQFFLEPALITLMALFLAFSLVELFRMPFNRISGKSILIDYSDPALWVIITAVYFITVVFSGIYPAFQASRLNSIQILSKRFRSGKGSMHLRTVLVVLQFTVSTLLVIAAMTISRQLDYINNADAGYDKENILVIDFGPPFTEKLDMIRQKILEIPHIRSVTGSSLLPSNVDWQVTLDWEGNQEGEPIPIKYLMVDYDFFLTFGMELVAGRTFSREFPSDDSIAYILNETAVNAMNLEEPVGKSIRFRHADFPEGLRKGTVIGVVEDFHAGSFHQEIPAMAIRIYRPWLNYLILRMDPVDVSSTVSFLGKLVDQVAPDYPFTYSFFSDTWTTMYQSEDLMNRLIRIFAILTLVISFLGIIGLSSYSAQRRTKEIGVRKVNGARSTDILRFLILDNLRYVIIAIVIALPVGWLIMDRWLRGYAYRVGLSAWDFILAALIAIIISLLTTVIQVYKKAVISPVKSLRYE